MGLLPGRPRGPAGAERYPARPGRLKTAYRAGSRVSGSPISMTTRNWSGFEDDDRPSRLGSPIVSSSNLIVTEEADWPGPAAASRDRRLGHDSSRSTAWPGRASGLGGRDRVQHGLEGIRHPRRSAGSLGLGTVSGRRIATGSVASAPYAPDDPPRHLTLQSERPGHVLGGTALRHVPGLARRSRLPMGSGRVLQPADTLHGTVLRRADRYSCRSGSTADDDRRENSAIATSISAMATPYRGRGRCGAAAQPGSTVHEGGRGAGRRAPRRTARCSGAGRIHEAACARSLPPAG